MRALILGDGNMAKAHREAYEALGVEIVENDPDIVSICTPDFMHGQNVIDALNAGCHVMCEKPLCTKIEELDQIQALSGELKICVNYPLRHHPPFDCLTKNVTLFEGHYFYGRKHKLQEGWRKDPRYSQVMGGLSHIVDLICFKSRLEMTVLAAEARNDVTKAVVKLSNGATGLLINDFSAYEGHSHFIRWGNDDGMVEIQNCMRTDKQREIKNFVTRLMEDGWRIAWRNEGYFHPTRAVLEIDRASHQVR